ncbi:hypothetical protein EVAR_4431_1 [Eumeta japonica]|uniref:Uncharacterized protein n=1 Tax=Eumeta variegata TaxID=151549 RepID=A0A4C1SXS7_EUMVA|nr:hypothetical protein EVAR_4431_1 [Eumeta japonica]
MTGLQPRAFDLRNLTSQRQRLGGFKFTELSIDPAGRWPTLRLAQNTVCIRDNRKMCRTRDGIYGLLHSKTTGYVQCAPNDDINDSLTGGN